MEKNINMYVALSLSVTADWKINLFFIRYQTSEWVFSASLSKLGTVGQILIEFVSFIIILP